MLKFQFSIANLNVKLVNPGNYFSTNLVRVKLTQTNENIRGKCQVKYGIHFRTR